MQLLVNLLKIVISQINIKGAIVCKLGQLNIRKEETAVRAANIAEGLSYRKVY